MPNTTIYVQFANTSKDGGDSLPTAISSNIEPNQKTISESLLLEQIAKALNVDQTSLCCIERQRMRAEGSSFPTLMPTNGMFCIKNLSSPHRSRGLIITVESPDKTIVTQLLETAQVKMEQGMLVARIPTVTPNKNATVDKNAVLLKATLGMISKANLTSQQQAQAHALLTEVNERKNLVDIQPEPKSAVAAPIANSSIPVQLDNVDTPSRRDFYPWAS